MIFFCAGPLLGSKSVFDCDLVKLNIINNHIESYICRVTSAPSDNSQEELYEELLKVRDGKILENAKHENLLALVTSLPLITTSYDNLDERAALNLANAKYYLANFFPDSQESQIFYQESYYLYSLLARRSFQENIKNASSTNMDRLLNEGKIRLVTQKQTTQSERLLPIVNEICQTTMDTLETMLHGIPDLLLSNFEGFGITLENTDRENLLKKLETHNKKFLVDERNKFKEETLERALKLNRRELEEEAFLINSVPIIEFTDTHLASLTHLIDKIIYFVHTTPLMKGRIPVLVPVGRSVSWIVKLWGKLPLNELNVDIPAMVHILASGLSNTTPTHNQKIGYKDYLDQLGFGEYESEHEVFLLDVSETGASLQKMQSLIEDLYPGLEKHTQNIALLYDGDTTDLQQTRVCYMDNSLREPMFAKHSEKQYYCPFQTFYPEDWEKGLSYFSPHEGAIKFEKIMDDWVEKAGYLQVFSMMEPLFSKGT